MKFTYKLVFSYATLIAIVAGTHTLFSSNRLFAQDVDSIQNQLSTASAGTFQSEWSLLIEKYKVQHQGSAHQLNIAVQGTYKSGLSNQREFDSSLAYREITQFLTRYPNETDYWEIVNRNLTGTLLKSHPALKSVTVRLEVLPTAKEPYTRSTTATRSADGNLLESWSFLTAQVTVPHHGGRKLNITTQYLYRKGLANSEYPDFVPIYQQIVQFLTNYSNDTDSWETINQKLVNKILNQYPVMASFQSKLEVTPTKDSPYHYFTSVTQVSPNLSNK